MSRPNKLVPLAQQLRQNTVPAEARMWGALRNRALGGFKFLRQHPVGSYVADFACVECKVVVELDGESHLESGKADQLRQAELEAAGWLVVRYWNTEVYDDLDAVKEAIYQACVARSKKTQ
jgi:very-short-patch-repair endonuclease